MEDELMEDQPDVEPCCFASAATFDGFVDTLGGADWVSSGVTVGDSSPKPSYK